MRVNHNQFTLAQLLMMVPLVAILVSFVNCGGCGRVSQVVGCLEFSPDGSKVVVVADSWRHANVPGKGYIIDVCHTLALIDAVSVSRPIVVKQEFRPGNLGVGLRCVNCPRAAFGADSTSLVVLWPYGDMRVWNVVSTLWRDTAYAEGQAMIDFDLSPNGDFLATATDNKVAVWETASKQPVWSLPTMAKYDYAMPLVTLSPDGEKLAVSDRDRVGIWDLESGTLLHEIRKGTDHQRVGCLEFSPDGHTVVLRCENGLYMHDLSTHEDRIVFPNRVGPNGESVRGGGDGTFDVAFSPDGRLLAVVGEYGARLLDSKTEWQVGRQLCGDWVACVAVSPDGETVVTGDYRGKVIFWDSATGRKLKTVAIPHKSRTPFTVPLAMLAVWILVCYISGVFRGRAHRRSNSRFDTPSSPG